MSLPPSSSSSALPSPSWRTAPVSSRSAACVVFGPGQIQAVPEASRVSTANVPPVVWTQALQRARGPPTLAWCQANGPVSGRVSRFLSLFDFTVVFPLRPEECRLRLCGASGGIPARFGSVRGLPGEPQEVFGGAAVVGLLCVGGAGLGSGLGVEEDGEGAPAASGGGARRRAYGGGGRANACGHSSPPA
ncbi:hypothetical protein C0992_012823 [Termitomyces sp. T32_za158]|nr:hypothetical protein C0992_012823 [Termitomyces sp. T32_za158]